MSTDLSNSIENYAELTAKIQQTRYAKFLEDDN
ncbi:hypothetical protein NO976_00733 [Planktothrix agardhii]|uniref:Uncharacterized protein n=1 Tax=Planktothrix agardhii TaxID=1160 RepID=A0AAD1Q1L0_PLAAG|nr:hypothetical protein NO976_00733 [Planktothrix agardhii]CAD5933183.1 hypothetical protein PANO66_01487 [Planktothrix agardhii]CAD5940374.1 hypothetical protein NO365_01878 [Planktothrix agardhii]CAD5941357.1 hypothetical protein PCC7811_01951 [Planktothrix agardhii]